MQHFKRNNTQGPDMTRESSGLGKTLGICALLLCVALLCLGLWQLGGQALRADPREDPPVRESAEAGTLECRVESGRARPAALSAPGKADPEPPALLRPHAVREYTPEGDGEKLVSVSWYFYDDEKGTGRVENEQGRLLQTLTLNEQGLIASAVFLDEDEEESYREEYSYDEKGDYTKLSRYQDGALAIDYDYTYDEDHMLQAAVITQYQDGKEVRRSELESLDKEKLEMRTYQAGKLMGTAWVERDYEDGKPVAQRNYNPDGALAYAIRWVRDRESLIGRTETSYPDGRITIVEKEYEPAETPALFRITYLGYGSMKGLDGETELSKERFYFYNEDGTGRVEDAEGRLLESLTLNEKGQIAESLVYDENGDLAKRVEYEYDRFGNQSHVRYYDAEGTLLSEWEYRCNAFRVQEYRVNRKYEDGQEVQRLEFVCLDRFHADFSIYYDGELAASQHFLYVYDGADLVEQRRINDDGSPGTSAFWTRDEDHNTLRYVTPAGPDNYSVEIFTYERIG